MGLTTGNAYSSIRRKQKKTPPIPGQINHPTLNALINFNFQSFAYVARARATAATTFIGM